MKLVLDGAAIHWLTWIHNFADNLDDRFTRDFACIANHTLADAFVNEKHCLDRSKRFTDNDERHLALSSHVVSAASHSYILAVMVLINILNGNVHTLLALFLRHLRSAKFEVTILDSTKLISFGFCGLASLLSLLGGFSGLLLCLDAFFFLLFSLALLSSLLDDFVLLFFWLGLRRLVFLLLLHV